jgi:tetratricopeptide (TPR) repeat protein
MRAWATDVSPGVIVRAVSQPPALVKSSYLVFGVTGALVLIGGVFFRPAASADIPRTPKSDGEELERLPLRTTDPHERERQRLGAVLAARPGDLRTAVALAGLDIELARARSDPRFLSYAQAALGPFWDMASPPPQALVLRATIRQSLHEFDAALADLDRVVSLNPGNAQAWITRSAVLAVQGKYVEAKASCDPLRALVADLIVAACESAIDGVTGSAAPAASRLTKAIQASHGVSPAEMAWATSTLAEISQREGLDDDAERHFKDALAIDPEDPYVLGAYADLLLDRGRPADAAKLVASRPENDALLLRLVLAERAMHASGYDAHEKLLRERFDASRLRGDTVYGREEARFELGAEDDPKKALALARANWAVQREPSDARVFLESAIAAKDPKAAKPVLDFIDANHLQGPTIQALATKLRSGGR